MNRITTENTPHNTAHKIDWNELWKESVNKLPKKNNSKSWDKIAPQFDQWMKKDDYPQELINHIQVESSDSILDIGCGNGVITIPIAQKARSVTAMDISGKMIELLRENAADRNLSNIKFTNKGIEDVTVEEIGPHDVVVASRSLNGIPDIKPELEKINKIAQKYVYITLWGVDNRKFESEMAELLGRESYQHPDYTIVYNLLHEMGIEAKIRFLKSNTRNYYSNIDEALDRIKWRIGDLNKEEESLIKEHLLTTLTKNPDGSLSYSRNNSKWVLIWWEKST
ncbi:MAG: class I SAM-dependent methyltransferase [Methanobacterium sp.]|nr:class I SAM-dependent methyltransferase [Methanobacterium sp.]